GVGTGSWGGAGVRPGTTPAQGRCTRTIEAPAFRPPFRVMPISSARTVVTPRPLANRNATARTFATSSTRIARPSLFRHQCDAATSLILNRLPAGEARTAGTPDAIF